MHTTEPFDSSAQAESYPTDTAVACPLPPSELPDDELLPLDPLEAEPELLDDPPFPLLDALDDAPELLDDPLPLLPDAPELLEALLPLDAAPPSLPPQTHAP